MSGMTAIMMAPAMVMMSPNAMTRAVWDAASRRNEVLIMSVQTQCGALNPRISAVSVTEEILSPGVESNGTAGCLCETQDGECDRKERVRVRLRSSCGVDRVFPNQAALARRSATAIASRDVMRMTRRMTAKKTYGFESGARAVWIVCFRHSLQYVPFGAGSSQPGNWHPSPAVS